MDKLKQIEEDMAQIKKISKRATSKKTAAKKKKPEEIKEVVKEEEEKQPIKPPSGLDPSPSKVESSEPAKVLDKIDEKDEGEAEDAPMEEVVDMEEAYDSALYDRLLSTINHFGDLSDRLLTMLKHLLTRMAAIKRKNRVANKQPVLTPTELSDFLSTPGK